MSAPDDLREQLARLVDDPPVAPDRLASVHRRAAAIRRRQTASLLSSVAALVAAVVLVGTLLPGGAGRLAGGASPFSPTALPTGILLADRQGHVVRLADLRATTTTAVGGPRIQRDNHSDAAVGTGPDGRSIIAYDTAGDIVVIDPAHPASPRVLVAHKGSGRSAWYDVPGIGRRDLVRVYLARGGALWLWAFNLGQHVAQQSDRALDSQIVAVDLEGRPLDRPIHLPVIDLVVAVGRKGVFVDVSGPTTQRVDDKGQLHPLQPAVQVWPGAGAYGRALTEPTQQNCTAGGTAGGRSTDECAYHLLDAETGKLAPLTGRPSTGTLVPEQQELSPDGRYIAVALLATRPLEGNTISSGWAVIDTQTGEITVVRGSLRLAPPAAANGTAVWSGDRLIWTSPTQDGRGTVVGGYLPANGRSVTTTVPDKGLRVMGAAG